MSSSPVQCQYASLVGIQEKYAHVDVDLVEPQQLS